MSGETVRIRAETYRKLKNLLEQSGEPMSLILEKAVEAYHRNQFLQGLSADFAALRSNRWAWLEELSERTAWDTTLADGLEDD